MLTVVYLFWMASSRYVLDERTCMLQSFAVSDPNIAAASTPTATKRERTASLGRPDMVEGFVFVAERLAEPDLEPSFIDDENPTFETDFTMQAPSDEHAFLSICLGAVSGTVITDQHRVCIDNISLEEID